VNIFYTDTSEWEEDYFKFDIFNQINYDSNINFLLFDDNFNDLEKYKTEKNIIVTNRGISVSYMETMIENLKPDVLFHLSDECLDNEDYYELYRKHKIPLLFHQYNSNSVNYSNNHFQIPLGYVKYFNDQQNSLDFHDDPDKIYDFSFIGSLKSDRNEMLDIFKNNLENNFISLGSTNWSNAKEQTIEPRRMNDIYKESVFVPIGRGNTSLDCFRIYEAVISSSIPVIVGDEEEIEETFYFNGLKPSFVYSDTWESAIIKCKEILNDKERQQKIIELNSIWWREVNNFIINKIKKQFNRYKDQP
jgi:hypothetical protein